MTLFRKKFKAPEPPPAPFPPLPPPSKKGTCILYLPQVLQKLPALVPLFAGPIGAVEIARLYDTLSNSAIVPPAPWQGVPHRFEGLITIPSIDAKGQSIYVPAFVFYPI